MAGAEAYAEHGVTRVHKLYLARMQRVIAECALDLAEGRRDASVDSVATPTWALCARPLSKRW